MRNILIVAFAFLLFSSCNEKGKDGKVLDTPTTGEVNIMVDEGYQPVIASVIDVFEAVVVLYASLDMLKNIADSGDGNA